MSLKQLIYRLGEGGGGLNQLGYTIHNISVPNSHNAHTPFFFNKSLSVYPPEGRGNNQPLIGPVTWNITDPNADPTFSGAAIDYSTVNILDGLERGGITVSANRHALDSERIFRFFNTPTGDRFIERQVGLQLTNPQVSAPQGQGLLASSPANQRTYNLGINTLTQVGLGGMVAGHIKREGTLPFNNRGYIDDKDFLENSTEKNRLLYLWNNKMATNPIPKGQGGFGSGLLSKIESLGDLISNVMNALGGKGEMLYDYSAGPGSTLGLGRTFIGRYTDTGKVKNNYDSTFDNSNQVFNYSSVGTWREGFIEGRETKYGTGVPGKSTKNRAQYQTLKDGTLNYSIYYRPSIDKVNAIDVFKNQNDDFPHFTNYNGDNIKDFIPFYFEAIDTDRPNESNVMYFRAFLDSMNDNFKATHTTVNYNGRAEDFYLYKGFNRDISFSFKVATQTRHEMMPLYRKLNYLASNTAPEYDERSQRIRTPFMRLTIGDYHKRLPGVLTSIGIKWNKNYPWEIKYDNGDKDAHMLMLPHILDVSVSYKPIHNFTPSKGINSPFIIPGSDNFSKALAKWLSLGIAEDTSEATTPSYKRILDTPGGGLMQQGSTATAEDQLQGVNPPVPDVAFVSPGGAPFTDAFPSPTAGPEVNPNPGTFEIGGAYDQYMESQ